MDFVLELVSGRKVSKDLPNLVVLFKEFSVSVKFDAPSPRKVM
jgi:hypothetical protein